MSLAPQRWTTSTDRSENPACWRQQNMETGLLWLAGLLISVAFLWPLVFIGIVATFYWPRILGW
ncbi:MAG: hypothetical protein ACREJU_06020 [Nitrospiraceae bacterium]